MIKRNILKHNVLIIAVLFLCVSGSYIFSQEVYSSEYKIGPKDELEISVAGWEEVSKTVRVTEEGKITLPYLGEIDVEGLTQAEASSSVKLCMWTELSEPQVHMN